jgi:glycosyltransferase involved in cell wall biosynthesis
MTPIRVTMAIHDAQRTGPPIYALDLLRWLKAHTDLDLRLVLLGGGPLVDDFAAVGPTVVVGKDPAAARAALEEADVTYVNTAASIEALRRTGARPRRVLSHVHEMDVALRHYLDPADLQLLMSVTDRFLVGPECARQNLVTGHGVPPERIGRVPYWVPRHDPQPATGGPSPREWLGLTPDTVVVGACGTREWRKAPDLFAAVAWEVERRQLDLPLRFVWLGSRIPSVDHWDEATDIDLLGLEGRLTFVENQPDPLPWMALFDVFALTSREDTFPLVALSAGSLGVPVVCFDTSGIPEMLRAADGGRVVPFLDLAGFADAVVDLAGDPGGRAEAGRRLQAHIAAEHDLDRSAGMVAEEIRQLVG